MVASLVRSSAHRARTTRCLCPKPTRYRRPTGRPRPAQRHPHRRVHEHSCRDVRLRHRKRRPHPHPRSRGPYPARYPRHGASTPRRTAAACVRAARDNTRLDGNRNRPHAAQTTGTGHLDAALRVNACTAAQLEAVMAEQKGRRGIVAVRDLPPHADGRAESPMESEMRLFFIDWSVPPPELQYEIVDRSGQRGASTSPGPTPNWPPNTTASSGTPILPHSPMIGSRRRGCRNAAGPRSRQW